MELGLTAVMLGMKDHMAQPPEQDKASLPQLKTPKSADDDFKTHFEAAQQELDKAIDLACDDIKNVKDRYGIMDIGKLRGGVAISILPPHSGQRTKASYWLKSDPGKKHSLEGTAAMVDACIKLEQLYDQANHHDAAHPPENLSYAKVTEKLLHRYQQKNPGQLDPKGLAGLQFIGSNFMTATMHGVMAYDRSPRAPRELQAANQRFLALFEEQKDAAVVIVDPHIGHVVHSLPVLFISKEEKQRQHGVIMVSDNIRTRFTQHMPIPDEATFNQARAVQPRSEAQSAMLSAALSHIMRPVKPAQTHSSELHMSGPLGIGTMDVTVEAEILNPTLHQNRVRAGTAEIKR